MISGSQNKAAGNSNLMKGSLNIVGGDKNLIKGSENNVLGDQNIIGADIDFDAMFSGAAVT